MSAKTKRTQPAAEPVAPPGYRLVRDHGRVGRPGKYGPVPAGAKPHTISLTADEQRAVGELLRKMRGVQ